MKLASLLTCCFLGGLAATAGAADPSAAPPTDQKPSRLTEMQARIDELELKTTGPEAHRLARSEHAILRYTNPIAGGTSQAATFLWLDGKRPAAAISLSYRPGGRIWWELTSLSDDPLELRKDMELVWKPTASSRKFERFPDSPVPAATPAARLTQLRELSRRFTVREFRREQWQDGRLLTQPLYRWSDEAAGTVDGAIFGYAETTDPELLLIIETRQTQGLSDGEWRFALAKMTSAPMIVTLADKEIYNVPGYWSSPRSPQDPYLEQSIDTYEVESPAQ